MNAPQTGAVGSNLPGPAPNTAGPHRHDILNKLDPTADSQSGGAQILGPGIHGSSAQGAPVNGRAGGGQVLGSGINTSAQGAPVAAQPGVANNYGPQHSSQLANALNPRVDSSQTRGAAAAPGISAQPATNAPQGTYGAHSTQTANTLDPRIDANANGRGRLGLQGQPGAAQPGNLTQPGPAPTTAGPHRHDIMNKLDPTVDSKAVAQQAQYRTA